ncbi:competence/damage-inducible protein A [Pseudohoeflea suaedae]|uniref:Competence/damage-inducible protein A n=2 Tax=Pseudohoeflea suaedae TaxID=877384 RepID=A0A4R5PPS5_9HYPH|nr:competence/damage-inducible protein A [Pseudohoeflea suaedae]TDH39019.1 competence/damage-inducible protein A [Pseudohoeflea suaedae]
MDKPAPVTAAMLAIGDELLSGRTKDKNIGHLAELLTAAGIELREVRIVGDEEDHIVSALNALRQGYDYVFTSGGIGPTHDDITADAVSRAFGVPCLYDDKAMALMAAHYQKRGVEFTEARKRMARMPQGAEHIDNPVSVAPGFVIGNVHVMAGVPSVFQAMLDNVMPTLRKGRQVLSRSIGCPLPEGDIGEPLRAVAQANTAVSIGSYPRFTDTGFANEIVVRGTEQSDVDAAIEAVQAMIDDLVARRAG